MPPRIVQNPKCASASRDLYEAYLDFIMSRQAMLCRERTVAWYSFTLDQVIGWMVSNGVAHPKDITAREVRAYFAELSSRGLSEATINNHARVIRTLLRFWHEEKYMPEPVKFKMPSVPNKLMRCLTIEEVEKVLRACTTKRDKPLVLLLVDSGARLAEVCGLKWQDVDIPTGMIRSWKVRVEKPGA